MERIIAVSYCRVSKEDQLRNDGPTIRLSLENQRARAEEVAAEQGYEYLKDYREEGITGEELETRPKLMKLLQDARAGLFNLVIMRHTNRIGRRQFIYHYVLHTLEVECKVQVLNLDNQQPVVQPSQFFPSRDNSRVYRRGIEGMLSESESNSRVVQLEVGRRNQILRGRYLNSQRHFGYKIEQRINDGKVERIPVPDPKEYWVLELLPKWLLEEGLSIGQIAARLDQMNAPTVTGVPWSTYSLTGIIHNPFYGGKQSYGTKNKFGLPPILADHNYEHPWNWQTYQAIMDRHEKFKRMPPRSKGSLNNPLAALVYCGHCKGRMTTWVHTHQDAKTRANPFYLRCSTHVYNTAQCSSHYVRLDRLLKTLWLNLDELVGEINKRPDSFLARARAQNLGNLRATLSTQSESTQRKLAVLETRLKNLDTAMLDGLPYLEFERLKQPLIAERSELETALYLVSQQEVSLKEKEVQLNKYLSFANEWAELKTQVSEPVETWDKALFQKISSKVHLLILRLEVIALYSRPKINWNLELEITWEFGE